jgi:Electron transfer DM13
MLSTRTLSGSQRRVTLVVIAILAVVALPLVWYLASPLIRNQTVNEARPSAAASLTGTFGVVDSIHRGEGTARILTLPNGQRVLRLDDDFRVTNGPDLYVYLSGHPAPRTSGDLHTAGDFEVAVLKGNIGGQNYDLPSDLDLTRFRSVVIYCRRFTTVFSTAELGS